ncbi:CD83 antigen-like [Thalassophryne amazonica]|uniref:CD83 antigen-like n=1 Tax=Thalassophryne amazonica TaxID=390379 RepID=UPI0014713C41|nr:CD83 antigen-like [Thalassophryne amazonica]
MFDLHGVLLLLSLALCLAVRQDVLEIKSVCGVDYTLRCTANLKPGVQYIKLTWYRQVEEQPSAVIKGLLSKKLPNGTIQRYNGIERHVDLLGNTGDLFLPNVTYSDSGIYVCHLAAPVGEQNQESQVHLILRGCPENPPNKVMLDAYAVIFATLLLITSLVIFVWSYRCLKKAMKERNESSKKEILLNVSSIPLEKKDLEMIYTLGPKWSKPHWTHTCL